MEIKDLQQRFSKVEDLLWSKSWFTDQKWIVAQHLFPKTKPDGVTLHVFKKHWFNEERLGIHFESYQDLNPKKQKKAYVTLHALHYDEFPGSKVSRKKFSQPLVDAIYSDVRKWDGYTFRAGKYGLQPFTKFLDATSSRFANDLTKELDRLCKVVGPVIDRVLESIIG